MYRFSRFLALCAAAFAASSAARGEPYEPTTRLLRPRTHHEPATSYLEEDRQPRILRYGDTSDKRFEEFLSPQTNPLYFEDPRSLTEARFVYLHNSLGTGLGAPGNIDYIGLQLRASITHRISVITTKAGFFCTDDSIAADDGWANTNAGIKLGLYANAEKQQLLSLGALYEIAGGSGRALQGRGNGELAMFLTGGSQLGPRGNALSAVGVRMPVDETEGAQILYWSNHLDHALFQTRVYAVAEANWYHYLRSGDQPISQAAGLDLFNLGNSNADGWDVITAAFGMRYKPVAAIEMGVIYELPVTERKDILGNRLGVDWITRY